MLNHTQCITFIDNNFHQEVIEAEVPLLVDCWATWCNPCCMQNSTISELAADFTGQVKVGRLNVENLAQAAMPHRIRVVPTLLIFQGGKVVSRIIGGVPKATIAAKLNELLQGSCSSRRQAV